MTTLVQAQHVLSEEWKQLSPQTPEEIAAFYQNTTNYKDDLDSWHLLPERYEWTNFVVNVASSCKAKTILDVGAGAGHDITALMKANPTYWIDAVEPNKDLQAHLLANVDVLTVHDDFSSVETSYDMITCLDVLEHVSDPELLLSEIIAHLKMGGIFVEATATHDISTPLHLPHLRGWSPGNYLDKHGFVVKATNDRLRVWQRIANERSSDPSLLLCAYRNVSAETAGILMSLNDTKWRVHIHSGDALVSRVRARAVSEWYQEDAGDVFLMIDDDVLFDPKDATKIVERVRETKSIVSGAYTLRDGSNLASRMLEGTKKISFGPNEKLRQIRWAATGFVAVHRDVITALIAKTPLCIMGGTSWFWPIFQPIIWYNKKHNYHEYLSEDWSFCERARKLGFKVWLDPSIILAHVSSKHYTVFDMAEKQGKEN